MKPIVTPAAIAAAARALKGALVETPCLYSHTLSQATGAQIWVKFENLQFTASFKERGALNRLLALSPDERKRGVVAMSAGNHAQGVARHAGRLGVPATIVMPKGTPFVKVAHTEALGARVLFEGESLAQAAAKARALAASDGLVFIHPYDDPWVIAGQGTLALEMLDQAPELDTLLVPVGGGGLIAGMAVAAKARRPDIRLIGVEAALYPNFQRALAGLAPAAERQSTIAEGIAVAEIGALPLALAKERVEAMILVDEAQIERAIGMLLEIEKTVAEGAGAAPLAALLAEPDRFRGRKVGLVLSGGNIDSRLLASVLMRGLARDGRLTRLAIDIGDVPGALARAAGLIGQAGGNIVEVAHQRLFGDIAAKAVELDVTVETQDRAHAQAILAALVEAGLPARLIDPVAANSGTRTNLP
ncbi:MAG: threonine ammonia-lyase [Rhodospirillales bacterium]|nr:threonine ammonia-lyase [Rhodospirillales bacterium]